MSALDGALTQFFAHVDALNVPYMVVLTADHGAIDAPERLGPPAQRIDVAALFTRLNTDLRHAYHLRDDPIIAADAHQLIINPTIADAAVRKALGQSAVRWLRAQPGIANAFGAAEVAKSTPPRGKSPTDLILVERLNRSFDAQRSGDILVTYAEGATLGVPNAPGSTVAGHGSPWDYDRRVPILFWWSGIEAKTMTKPIETVDIAPTLAAVMGLKAPRVDGHCVEIGQHCPKR
jgi:predicted AlkP superfamily pyrophosphatase or phosphodiesterase